MPIEIVGLVFRMRIQILRFLRRREVLPTRPLSNNPKSFQRALASLKKESLVVAIKGKIAFNRISFIRNRLYLNQSHNLIFFSSSGDNYHRMGQGLRVMRQSLGIPGNHRFLRGEMCSNFRGKKRAQWRKM